MSLLRSGEDLNLGLEFGILQNVSKDHAWGGTFFILNQDEKGMRYGVRAIYRRWLSDEIGVDLAPGIVLFASEQQAPALSGQVALDMWGIIAPMCEIDMIRKDDRVEWSLLAGARGGSYLALACGCLMGAFIIALAMDPD